MAPINVLGNEYFEPTSQLDESCFYLPDLGPDDPVIFRGQCDQNIPVVQNFNPERVSYLSRITNSFPNEIPYKVSLSFAKQEFGVKNIKQIQYVKFASR